MILSCRSGIYEVLWELVDGVGAILTKMMNLS